MISRCYISIQNIVVIATAIGFTLARFSAASEEDQKKVQIELYYESQCPGCREMITTSFNEAYRSEGFLDMADVLFVPYGNAEENQTDSGTYEFDCQHGPPECIYNIIENCALDKIEDPLTAFQYIECIEQNDESRDPKQDYYQVAIDCCRLTNLDDDTVSKMESCALGSEGMLLEHGAAVKSNSLDPPYNYVPYVVVNGEHSEDVQDKITDSLFNYVCDSYQGPNKSSACPKTHLRAGQLFLGKKELCYRENDAAMVAEE